MFYGRDGDFTNQYRSPLPEDILNLTLYSDSLHRSDITTIHWLVMVTEHDVFSE